MSSRGSKTCHICQLSAKTSWQRCCVVVNIYSLLAVMAVRIFGVCRKLISANLTQGVRSNRNNLRRICLSSMLNGMYCTDSVNKALFVRLPFSLALTLVSISR